MYMPSHFEETRVEVMHDLVRLHPFGTLVTMGNDGLDANHLPFMIDPDPAPYGTLRAHVARANPVWREASAAIEPLVIFQGAHTYITPSWYRTKAETGKVVPTFNYAVVHAHGVLRAVEDADWLWQFVGRLTDRFEAGRARPWGVGDAPADFIAAQLRAIVGIEIRITRLVGKWKVSQNRPPVDRAGVVAGLRDERDTGAQAMAELVERADRTRSGQA